MEIKQLKQVEVVTDVLCDVCNQLTQLEFGTLSANWGCGSKHDGERYELQLCEKCFFYALATSLPAGLESLLVSGAGALAAEGAAAAAERLLEPGGQPVSVLVAWGRLQYERFQAALGELHARQMQTGAPPYAAWEEVEDV